MEKRCDEAIMSYGIFIAAAAAAVCVLDIIELTSM